MQVRGSWDVIVIGGGLAGLATAAYAIRGARRVLLVERASRFGGRAITSAQSGYHFNIGAHALYRGGATAAAMADLGVSVSGGTPLVSGGLAYNRGRLHTLPVGAVSLMVTDLLHATEKLDLATFQGGLEDMDPGPLESQTVDDWLSHALATDGARAVMLMLIRTTTYTNLSDRLSAGAALRQLKLARAGVLYLDEGWGAMAGRLAERAVQAGVKIESSRPVRCVEEQEDRAIVRFGDGSIACAAAVVIATRPREAIELLGDNVPAALSCSIAAAEPANVACLDVGLRHLPKPDCQFALGFDQPFYLSVHSSVARLAPEGGALIHTAKYLGPEPSDPVTDRRELEALLDVAQPGWRGLVEAEQFLPSITVTDAVPLAGHGGLPGRLSPEAPGYKRVLFAGDWIGPQGLLADASLASAKQAAALATEVSRTWAVDVLRG